MITTMTGLEMGFVESSALVQTYINNNALFTLQCYKIFLVTQAFMALDYLSIHFVFHYFIFITIASTHVFAVVNNIMLIIS